MTQNITLERPKKYYVDTSRGYVHVQDVGTSDKVIAFVTITSFGGVLMDQALPLLAAAGYRAVSIDMMGYGRSDKREGQWLMDDLADNMIEVMDLVGQPADIWVAGHFAGLIGVELGARPAPGMKGLVLEGAPLINPEVAANFATAEQPKPTEWTEDGAQFLDYWKRSYGLIKRLNPDFQLPLVPDNQLRRTVIEYFNVGCYEPGVADAYALFDARARMKQIKVPTQVMCSDTDWNLVHHQTFVDDIPDSREVRFPGVHPLHDIADRTRAGEYVKVIDAFAKDILKG